jgi:hypothetical protein
VSGKRRRHIPDAVRTCSAGLLATAARNLPSDTATMPPT